MRGMAVDKRVEVARVNGTVQRVEGIVVFCTHISYLIISLSASYTLLQLHLQSDDIQKCMIFSRHY